MRDLTRVEARKWHGSRRPPPNPISPQAPTHVTWFVDNLREKTLQDVPNLLVTAVPRQVQLGPQAGAMSREAIDHPEERFTLRITTELHIADDRTSVKRNIIRQRPHPTDNRQQFLEIPHGAPFCV